MAGDFLCPLETRYRLDDVLGGCMHLRMGDVGAILGLIVAVYWSIRWYRRKHKMQ
jgi:hypothetical protein